MTHVHCCEEVDYDAVAEKVRSEIDEEGSALLQVEGDKQGERIARLASALAERAVKPWRQFVAEFASWADDGEPDDDGLLGRARALLASHSGGRSAPMSEDRFATELRGLGVSEETVRRWQDKSLVAGHPDDCECQEFMPRGVRHSSTCNPPTWCDCAPLDAAWKEAEAALPRDWCWFSVGRAKGAQWFASADADYGRAGYDAVGATPAAALRALTDRLVNGEFTVKGSAVAVNDPQPVAGIGLGVESATDALPVDADLSDPAPDECAIATHPVPGVDGSSHGESVANR